MRDETKHNLNIIIKNIDYKNLNLDIIKKNSIILKTIYDKLKKIWIKNTYKYNILLKNERKYVEIYNKIGRAHV